MPKMFYDPNTPLDEILPPTVLLDGDLSATLRSLASRLRFDHWDRCFSDACLSAAAIIEAKQGGMLTQLANRSYAALADTPEAQESINVKVDDSPAGVIRTLRGAALALNSTYIAALADVLEGRLAPPPIPRP